MTITISGTYSFHQKFRISSKWKFLGPLAGRDFGSKRIGSGSFEETITVPDNDLEQISVFLDGKSGLHVIIAIERISKDGEPSVITAAVEAYSNHHSANKKMIFRSQFLKAAPQLMISLRTIKFDRHGFKGEVKVNTAINYKIGDTAMVP